ncbi:MAG: tetratricopeptide repeat protein [Vicinamibacterales bacterium]
MTATIGPYRVLGELGQGGMGTVVLAEDTRLGRHVALKMVSGAQAGTSGGRAQLLDEARAAAALVHPAIATVHDVIEHDGEIAIVFELVEGETLAARLKKGPLPPDQALHVAAQIAEALSVAHAHGVLHRDLKPSNVMLAPGGVVKILDFGIARMRPAAGSPADEAPADGDGGFQGTPGYVAPEQWAGKTADERADLYALGVVLFEMLTGKRPFPERDPFTLAHASIDRMARRVSSLKADVPPALDRLVSRLLATDPGQRPPKARVVADEIRALQAPPAPVALPWRRWAAVAAALVVALAGAAWWVTRPVVLDVTDPVIAVLPFANGTGDDGNDYLAAGVADSLTTSLSSLPTLTVVPRASVADARARRRTPGQVAADLGATFVVDGTVDGTGDALRIAVRLLRPDGTAAWTEDVEGPAAGVFGMQARLATALGAALRLQLSPDVRTRISTPPSSNPDALDAYWRGRALLERRDSPGNLPRAILAFGEALRLDPRFVDAHAALAEAYAADYGSTRDAQAIERAVQANRDAVTLAPDDPAVRLALGTTLVASGRHAEAIQALQRALAMQPSLDDARRQLGNALAGLGRIDEAVAEWKKALERRPTNWQVYSDMGRALFRAARYDEAEAALQRLTTLQPDNAFGFQQLGTLYQIRGLNDKALEYYAKANAISPSARIFANVGAIYHTEGRFEDAVASYRRAIALAPNISYVHRNLGDALLRMGRRNEALAAYRDAVERAEAELAVSPSDPRLLATVAVYAQKAGDGASAAARIAEAVAKAPDDVEVCYRAAVVHALAGSEAQALDWLRRALALGYSKSTAAADDDFHDIRNEPRFAALVADGPGGGRGR